MRGLAAGQHGIVTRAQLLDLGASDHEIVRRLRNGRIDQLHDGVYYLDSVPATWFTDVRAAVYACGPAAVASHRTGSAIWELDGLSTHIIEISVPYTKSPEPSGVVVHRTRRPNPYTERTAIPVTVAEKTIMDMAAIVPPRVLAKLARSAVYQDHTTADRLDEAIGKFGGRGVTGTRVMRRMLATLFDDFSGSVSEVDLRTIVVDAPIPQPVQQLRVHLPTGANAYPDFAWPDLMRIVDVDGFGAHGSPDQLDADLRRQNLLMELGWEIRRFTARRIREDPHSVREEIVQFVNRPSVNAGHASRVSNAHRMGTASDQTR